MAGSLQAYLSTAIPKACDDLLTAIKRLPEDKRGWSPMADARTALNQVAECAILNGSVGGIILSKAWPETWDMGEYLASVKQAESDFDGLEKMLRDNTAKIVDVIQSVPDSDLGIVVDMPWGPASVAQMCAYPFWNMAYHEGQINYIASMLGCLD